jgi:hypothetical protein
MNSSESFKSMQSEANDQLLLVYSFQKDSQMQCSEILLSMETIMLNSWHNSLALFVIWSPESDVH